MTPELYKEYPDPDEAAKLDRLSEVTMRTLRQKYLTGPQLRDTHAKGLAVVLGTFTIDANLPQDLKVGMFATPATYQVMCRFSNTDPNPKPDIKNDMRAVSIKVFDVPGPKVWNDDPESNNVDLLMMTAKTFITPDLHSFTDMQEALLTAYLKPFVGNLGLIWFFLTHPGTAKRVINSEIQCANVLEMPYFSETAYRFGEKAVQYKLVPHKAATSRLPGPGAAFNYLNDRLRADLAAGDAVFDFMVQLQVDPVKMPIEDSSVPWDETLSPPRKVATLTLHKQVVEESALTTTGEHLSFNPWRTLPEHAPLGWTNRVRARIYEEVSKFRHKRNSVPVREPRLSDQRS